MNFASPPDWEAALRGSAPRGFIASEELLREDLKMELVEMLARQ